VLRVRLPPLRDRKEDLPLLVEALTADKGVTVLPETLTLLGEYDWPGNIRELGNVIERALTLLPAGEALAPAHLGLERAAGRGSDGKAAIEDFHLAKERLIEAWERDFLRRLIEASGHNMSKAARASGLGRAHLYRLIKKYEMT
jgi:DNA-binding NtrC family response regulator